LRDDEYVEEAEADEPGDGETRDQPTHVDVRESIAHPRASLDGCLGRFNCISDYRFDHSAAGA
jgi:hypothetical protein